MWPYTDDEKDRMEKDLDASDWEELEADVNVDDEFKDASEYLDDYDGV